MFSVKKSQNLTWKFSNVCSFPILNQNKVKKSIFQLKYKLCFCSCTGSIFPSVINKNIQISIHRYERRYDPFLILSFLELVVYCVIIWEQPVWNCVILTASDHALSGLNLKLYFEFIIGNFIQYLCQYNNNH